MIESLLDKYVFSNCKTGNAIDVGCGSGVFTELIAKRGWSALGVDVSSEMIAKARSRVRANSSLAESLSFDMVPIEKLVREPASYDLVLSLSALEYIEDDSAALHTLVELTRPGGFVVLSVPNRSGLVRIAERMLYRIRKLSRDRFLRNRGDYLAFQKHQYTSKELDRMMLELGMEKKTGRFLNAAVQLPRWLLGLFERQWWAAMYLGGYQKTAD
jgi:2-polyprenyl-6-hydroxyphenyl methylase/3-demethylubiquinone-9 3-methyltransferase